MNLHSLSPGDIARVLRTATFQATLHTRCPTREHAPSSCVTGRGLALVNEETLDTVDIHASGPGQWGAAVVRWERKDGATTCLILVPLERCDCGHTKPAYVEDLNDVGLVPERVTDVYPHCAPGAYILQDQHALRAEQDADWHRCAFCNHPQCAECEAICIHGIEPEMWACDACLCEQLCPECLPYAEHHWETLERAAEQQGGDAPEACLGGCGATAWDHAPLPVAANGPMDRFAKPVCNPFAKRLRVEKNARGPRGRLRRMCLE